MKVKTTFTVEVICDLDQCVAYSVVLSDEDKDHEKDNMESCIKDSLGFPEYYGRPICITCTGVQREPIIDGDE